MSLVWNFFFFLVITTYYYFAPLNDDTHGLHQSLPLVLDVAYFEKANLSVAMQLYFNGDGVFYVHQLG